MTTARGLDVFFAERERRARARALLRAMTMAHAGGSHGCCYEPGIAQKGAMRASSGTFARRLDLRERRLGHVRRVEVDGDALQRALDGLLRAGVLPSSSPATRRWRMGGILSRPPVRRRVVVGSCKQRSGAQPALRERCRITSRDEDVSSRSRSRPSVVQKGSRDLGAT